MATVYGMGLITNRLADLGLELPPPMVPPPGVVLPFRFVRVVGDRAFVAGHGPQSPDGSVGGPFGRLGDELSVEDGYAAARATALSMLGSLQRELDDLDRIAAWGRVFGMVASAPDFRQQPLVINGFSDLIIEVFGPDVGAHARSAVGMVALPFGIPVEVEAEIVIKS